MIGIIVVSNGQIDELRATLDSVKRLVQPIRDSVIVQIQMLPPMSIDNRHWLETYGRYFDLRMNVEKDSGIYDAMNRALDAIELQCPDRIIFMNAGDQFNFLELGEDNWNKACRCTDSEVSYSDVALQNGEVVESKLEPWILRMPHHQSMTIPSSVFFPRKFRFDSSMRFAGDLELKLFLIKSRCRYVKRGTPLAVVQEAGRSGEFDWSSIRVRADEMGKIAKKFNRSRLYCLSITVLYFAWYCVRSLTSQAEKKLIRL